MTAPVVRTPLWTEWLALRGRLDVPVVRTGRSRGASLPVPDLVAGLAGALTSDVAPGDLVVAGEVRGERGPMPSHAAPLVAGELRRAGLRVHVGPVVTTRRVVDSTQDRAALAARGAVAVDTESALLASPDGTTVVVRVVTDTPRQRLLSPALPARAVRALATLRRTAPVLDRWAAAVGEREVVLATPRSFCAGVERAIHVVESALDRFGAPVHVRRQIVHNRHVVEELERRGAVFVEEADEVPEGGVVVFSAHGVAPAVRRTAEERGLRVIDATCPLVWKVHREVGRFAAADRTVLLIGHHDHEEVVGTRGEAPDHVVVVADPEEAARVSVPDPERVSYVMQTTLAVDDAAETAAVLRERFPALAGPHTDDICYATTNRQQAVREVAARTELVIVVGSPNSSNSQRLVEVAEAAGTPAHLVDDVSEVELSWLAGVRRVGITAGASAPPALVDDVVQSLAGLGPVHVREHGDVVEDIAFAVPKELSREVVT
ncbi:MAG TPA: 4-hydroxy-3-methylbut-2-enyl diphosphate reductase [Nocardioides sp.]|uniref:4-hydroxy-3-methylbut-2-enyl diphosphate reductase n=1 Tax=Nocardioides sp. TaxID=35761 RepID=UPI002E31C2BA|nr:4-hydroxy-3-methylbut-2-enyl diphosphate reductase [Nocardioides sp.]HEX5087642.1 4-hydroxy-3-methylbut-2-enyl diphosphate reductase [Nocardioides sp.]